MLALAIAADVGAGVLGSLIGSCGVPLCTDSACLEPAAYHRSVDILVAFKLLGHVTLTIANLAVLQLMVVQEALLNKDC
jgi:hypothetical protein